MKGLWLVCRGTVSLTTNFLEVLVIYRKGADSEHGQNYFCGFTRNPKNLYTY